MKFLASLGNYLQTKRNFLIYSIWVIGVPGAAGLIWLFGEYGGIGYWLFLAAAAFLAAYGWGTVMWLFFSKKFSEPHGEQPRHD